MFSKSVVRTLVVLAAIALLGTQFALAAGIVDTKHNLSSSGSNTIKGSVDEVCVFCHTPHHSQGTAADRGPLWNRSLSSASYTIYSSPTLDATPSNPPTSVSKACLSCHDGTIGINQLTNMPGSGMGVMPSNATDTKITGAATLIGNDLSNDHPVSMIYTSAASPGQGAVLGTDTHASGFRPTTTVGTRTVIQNSGTTLPLYSGKVECGSCHDPHEDRTFVDSVQVSFLRADNTGSALCITCHLK